MRHHTLAQARFYVEHLGADFSDYLREDAAYAAGLATTVAALQVHGRYQIVDRDYLANFVFGDDELVMALGQDGLVANTMKYLRGHALVGINPEPGRWDGVLLPFTPDDVPSVLADVVAQRRPVKTVTMAEARLSDGQVMRAVNDLFIGPRSHTSALYDIALGAEHESQSSSGVIVSTGTRFDRVDAQRGHRLDRDRAGPRRDTGAVGLSARAVGQPAVAVRRARALRQPLVVGRAGLRRDHRRSAAGPALAHADQRRNLLGTGWKPTTCASPQASRRRSASPRSRDACGVKTLRSPGRAPRRPCRTPRSTACRRPASPRAGTPSARCRACSRRW